MTQRQLAFWLSVKPHIEHIVTDAKECLRDKPVGFSLVSRLPERFSFKPSGQIPFMRQPPMLMVTKSPEGLVASEYKIAHRRKGFTHPKARVIAAVNW